MQIFKLVEAARLTCLFFISPREMSAQSVSESMDWEEHLSTQECICDFRARWRKLQMYYPYTVFLLQLKVWSLRRAFGLEIKLWMKGKASFSIAFCIWTLLVISPKQHKSINWRELSFENFPKGCWHCCMEEISGRRTRRESMMQNEL